MTPKSIHKFVNTLYLHIYINTYMHTYTRTYIVHTYINTQKNKFMTFSLKVSGSNSGKNIE